MNIARALTIDGWMAPQELEWLAFEASRHQVIVEIGSYLGRSARAMADNTPGVVYCVDDWYAAEFEIPHKREELYDMFCANLADLIDEGKVIPIHQESARAASRWEAPRPDMVFIDGSHDGNSVRRDLQAWEKIIRLGGLLCGHDAHLPGVAEARRVHLPEHFSGIGDLWALPNFNGLKA